MNEKNFTLTKQDEQDLANLYETKYFQALQALVDEELDTTKTYMLNKKLSADELRFYQGRAEGLGVVLLRIHVLHEAATKETSK